MSGVIFGAAACRKEHEFLLVGWGEREVFLMLTGNTAVSLK